MPDLALRILTSRLGLCAAVFLGMLVFYEGMPLGPLTRIPVAGEWLEGHLGGRIGAVAVEARRQATAEATANFFSAMGDLTDEAEKARAARRYCLDSGRVYDIAAGNCR